MNISETSWPFYSGKVILNGVLGDDRTVVNAARVSFNKKVDTLDDKDIKLISYLATHKHMSPFRHVQFSLTLEKIPEFVLRQLYKHQVGISYTAGEFKEQATPWNEVSGRYVEFDFEFHSPSTFRKQSPSNRQASLRDVEVDDPVAVREVYEEAIKNAYASYTKLLSLGVCKEQSRYVVPLAFETSVVWTASLEALVHFVKLRDHTGAQVEIQDLARIVHGIVREHCPYSTEALLGHSVS